MADKHLALVRETMYKKSYRVLTARTLKPDMLCRKRVKCELLKIWIQMDFVEKELQMNTYLDTQLQCRKRNRSYFRFTVKTFFKGDKSFQSGPTMEKMTLAQEFSGNRDLDTDNAEKELKGTRTLNQDQLCGKRICRKRVKGEQRF